MLINWQHDNSSNVYISLALIYTSFLPVIGSLSPKSGVHLPPPSETPPEFVCKLDILSAQTSDKRGETESMLLLSHYI